MTIKLMQEKINKADFVEYLYSFEGLDDGSHIALFWVLLWLSVD